MPDLTLSNVQPMGSRSATDNNTYIPTVDFQRRLAVNVAPDDWLFPVGRILYRDDFEDALSIATATKWSTAVGTVTRDNTTAHKGANCMKLTTGAVAGNQATARKFFTLPADQGFQITGPGARDLVNRTSRIITGMWWRQADVNMRSIALRLVVDDSARAREGWLIYHRRQAAANFNIFTYIDSTSTEQTWGTYPVDDNTANRLDVWNFLGMELDYLNGTDAATPPGYLYYRTARCADFIKPDRPNLMTSPISGPQGVTSGAKGAFVDITVTTDNNNACAAFVDDFMLTDLSWSANM